MSQTSDLKKMKAANDDELESDQRIISPEKMKISPNGKKK